MKHTLMSSRLDGKKGLSNLGRTLERLGYHQVTQSNPLELVVSMAVLQHMLMPLVLQGKEKKCINLQEKIFLSPQQKGEQVMAI